MREREREEAVHQNVQYLFTNKLYKKLFKPVLFSCDELTLKTKRIAMVKNGSSKP